jgi:pimeloyl-ACP methyl ester carboxylesterase
MLIQVQGRTVYSYTGTKPIVAGQRTIVFIHGAAADHSVWALQSRYFAYHGFNVLALDLPGHGKSAGPALATIEELAVCIFEVLRAVKVQHTVLVGHSMGSLIALHAAGSQPERVEKLVLIGSAFPMRVSEALLDTAKAGDHAALDMINVWSHSASGQAGGNRVPGQWIMGGSMRLLERTMAPLYRDFKACNDYAAGLESAQKVRCPVLMISGQGDVMTPVRAAQPLAKQLAHVQMVSLEGCGHDLMAEQPDRVLDALIAFV